MTENKQFKIVNDCGDYHLLDGDEQLGYDLCSYSMRKANWNNVVDKLNEQEELIKRLKQIKEEQTETILTQKRKMQELEERNKRQYNRLKKITDLMLKRDWKTLNNMVDDWEKQEKLLEQEYDNCGDE